ncbi:MAG TPA: YihY/virulence factor BrkB family protein [Gaiellaceae bacterium]|nr:YihY/virulence factor BrkB family protein [Gaiellaceae bacterium]
MKAELAALELDQVTRKRIKKAVAGVYDDFMQYDLLTYSSAIAFQVLYAVVPLVMLALGVLGDVGAQSVYTNHIAHTLRHALSHDAYSLANRTALNAIGPEKIWWTSIGLVVTLWGVGAALRSMMTPLNAVYGARETRSWLRRLVESIAGGAVVLVCVYGAMLAVLAGRLMHPSGAVYVVVFVTRWLVAIALLLVAVATLIRAVPAKKRPVEWLSVGSSVSIVCWIVATLGFAAYISTVSYSSFYGAFAAIVLLLIYLHVSAIAFLLGVTVDAHLRELVRKQGSSRRRR